MDYQIPTFEELLYADSRLEVQLTLLLFQASIWNVVIPFMASNIVEPFMHNKSYKKQWTVLNKHSLANIGINVQDDEAYHFSLLMIPILFQHGIGGMLCLPAVMGWFSPQVRTAMAMHGALCEAGWEFQDLLNSFRITLIGTAEERKMKPPQLVIFMCVHHAMGLSMVVPMNLFHGDFYYYHEGAFLLQGAAFFAMFFQQYGFTLDTSTSSGYMQMRVVVLLVFLIMGYSRGPRYFFVVYQVVNMLYEGDSRAMFYGSVVAATLMMTLNCLFINDAFHKLKKFWVVKADPKTTQGKTLIRQASSEALGGLGFQGFVFVPISSAQARWGKVRGAVHMMSLQKELAQNKQKDTADKKKD